MLDEFLSVAGTSQDWQVTLLPIHCNFSQLLLLLSWTHLHWNLLREGYRACKEVESVVVEGDSEV